MDLHYRHHFHLCSYIMSRRSYFSYLAFRVFFFAITFRGSMSTHRLHTGMCTLHTVVSNLRPLLSDGPPTKVKRSTLYRRFGI